MNNRVHRLKLNAEYFDHAKEYRKMFEIRRHDRIYKVGDVLALCKWCDAEKQYLDEVVLFRRITYMTDYQQKPGYVVLGLAEDNNPLWRCIDVRG